MPHKVLFLTLKVFGFTGGIEKVCRSICRSLYDLGEENIVEPTVYSMYDKYFDRDSRYLKKQQYHAFNEHRKYFVIKSLLKGIRSDVVILSHINLLSIGYLIKRFSPKTKVYLLAHGIEIWRKLPEPKLKALKRLDKIIAVSHFTAERIKSIHGTKEDKIEILNNCIDPFYFFPTKFSKPKPLLERYQLHPDQKILMSLSRVVSSEKYKGYDNTISILPHLIKKYPKLVYLIAGKSDDEEKLRLEKLITKHQIANHIKLIGFIDEAEITDHFLLSDIFVMPSKKEGFGIVFIEAMASGLSVIAGNKDGSVDALKNGELGKLVNPDDSSEIEKTLDELLKSPLNDNEKIALQKKVLKAFSYEKYRESIKKLIVYGTSYIMLL
ncbi:glycosyltransferase family 4 protein [Pedobacter boryungensis]|uniref:Glycosyltransferase family 4 protein n=1 Tax=Pedobacter boryungensis TaxID=869962 RepID=A0ABX2DA44_9SPHI|nr:glycosyltransferase family 4 protein [Pedobacter boryungensis]NQX30186.1 glycosyltransferase family 4 protein [Pedobacter boryungensis]